MMIYAGVRVSLTSHVRCQDQVSKNLIDLFPPPPAQRLSFAGAMQWFHVRSVLRALMTARALWGFTTDLNRLCKNSGFTFQQTEMVFGASDAGVN